MAQALEQIFLQQRLYHFGCCGYSQIAVLFLALIHDILAIVDVENTELLNQERLSACLITISDIRKTAFLPVIYSFNNNKNAFHMFEWYKSMVIVHQGGFSSTL